VESIFVVVVTMNGKMAQATDKAMMAIDQMATLIMDNTALGKKELKKLYHCKKVDHLRRNCWYYKN